MTTLEDAWLDLRELHAAIEVERKVRGLTWIQVQAEAGGSASTIARFARDRMPTEADGVFSLLDWLGLPAETFIRGTRPDARLDLSAKVANLLGTHPELTQDAAGEVKAAVLNAWEPAGAARPQLHASIVAEDGAVGPGVTRIDALALHAAVDARRRERGLTWADVRLEMGFPAPGMFTDKPRQASPTDLGRRGLGGRQEAHACVAVAHWLGVPVDSFLRRLGGREAPSRELGTQISRLIQSHAGLSSEAAAKPVGRVQLLSR